jgi:hypothetical protein
MSFAVFSVALGLASLRRATWLSVTLYLGSIITLACAIVLAMGQPRPQWTFLRAPHDATLLASRLQEPVAIYLWLLPDGVSVPVAVKLPWSESAAMRQQIATQAAHLTRGRVRLRFVRGQPEFYATTIKPMPAKVGEQ